MFIRLVKMCIVEVYLVFLKFKGRQRMARGILQWSIWGKYHWAKSEGNIKGEYEFIILPLFSFIVYGPAFPVF